MGGEKSTPNYSFILTVWIFLLCCKAEATFSECGTIGLRLAFEGKISARQAGQKIFSSPPPATIQYNFFRPDSSHSCGDFVVGTMHDTARIRGDSNHEPTQMMFCMDAPVLTASAHGVKLVAQSPINVENPTSTSFDRGSLAIRVVPNRASETCNSQ
jgi:hypothetical protein